MINQLIGRLKDYDSYNDVGVICGDSWKDHSSYLCNKLAEFTDASLTVILITSEFKHGKVICIGYVVDSGWVKPHGVKI